jgi:transposase-like protein
MEKIPKGVYTKEFKEEAVKLVTEARLSIPEVSRRLSVNKSTLEYWLKQARKGVLSGRKDAVTPEDMKLALLRKENAELRTEREILKKAAVSSTCQCNT